MASEGKLTDIPGVSQIATPERTNQIEKAVEGEVIVGRPTSYTEEIGNQICEWLAQGKSLNRYCQQEDTPALKTVYNWLNAHEEFLQNYTRAKEDSADTLADDILDMADDVAAGKLEPNAGRVAIDAKKWAASKLKPRKYGDKIDLTTGGGTLPQPILAVMGVQSTPDPTPAPTIAPPKDDQPVSAESVPYKIVDENTIDEIIGDDE